MDGRMAALTWRHYRSLPTLRTPGALQIRKQKRRQKAAFLQHP
jgi:hypothetical protein